MTLILASFDFKNLASTFNDFFLTYRLGEGWGKSKKESQDYYESQTRGGKKKVSSIMERSM